MSGQIKHIVQPADVEKVAVTRQSQPKTRSAVPHVARSRSRSMTVSQPPTSPRCQEIFENCADDRQVVTDIFLNRNTIVGTSRGKGRDSRSANRSLRAAIRYPQPTLRYRPDARISVRTRTHRTNDAPRRQRTLHRGIHEYRWSIPVLDFATNNQDKVPQNCAAGSSWS